MRLLLRTLTVIAVLFIQNIRATDISAYTTRLDAVIGMGTSDNLYLDGDQFFGTSNKFDVDKAVTSLGTTITLSNVDITDLLAAADTDQQIFGEFLKKMDTLKFVSGNSVMTAKAFFTKKHNLPKLTLRAIADDSVAGTIGYLDFLEAVRAGTYAQTATSALVTVAGNYYCPATWPAPTKIDDGTNYVLLSMDGDLKTNSDNLVKDVVGMAHAFLGKGATAAKAAANAVVTTQIDA